VGSGYIGTAIVSVIMTRRKYAREVSGALVKRADDLVRTRL